MSKRASFKEQLEAGAAVGANRTLIAFLSDRGLSHTESLHVLKFVAIWGLTTEKLGREPRVIEDICEVVPYRRATAFKWQTAFRDAFPEYQTPAVLWSIVRGWADAEDVEVMAMQLAGAEVPTLLTTRGV